jgi:hypothetical protein
MSGSSKPGLISLQSLFGTAASAGSNETPKRMWPDRATVVQQLLAKLKSDLRISAQESEPWAAFSSAVLAQMERLTSAREAADGVAWSVPGSDDRKRTLVRQVIATPMLLSQAARSLYSALTPEQQSIAGEELLHFHRRLVG